jgi:hypothetical protein
MNRGSGHYLWRGAFLLAGVVALLIPVSAQNTRETAPADRDWSKIAGNFGDVKVHSSGPI